MHKLFQCLPSQADASVTEKPAANEKVAQGKAKARNEEKVRKTESKEQLTKSLGRHTSRSLLFPRSFLFKYRAN